MNKIMIITSYVEGTTQEIRNLILSQNSDFVICADGGYDIATQVGITPDLVVGDFDSSKLPPSDTVPTLSVPIEKDYTDLQLALSIAHEKGAQEAIIIGGIGGRVDHTIGNIQTMVYYSQKGLIVDMVDPYQSVFIHMPGTRVYSGNSTMKFSVFAHSEKVTDLTYSGAYYPLDKKTLLNNYPLGISNEFLDDKIEVTTESGILIITRTSL